MRILIPIIVFITMPSLTTALDINGYYENTLVPEYSNESKERIFDASKLRLDFSSGGGENELQFKANVNFIEFHAGAKYDLTPYLPKSVADTLAAWDIPVEMEVSKSRIFLDNAYLTWRINSLSIRLGRQQLSWGPAYSFNPTDLFHKKELLDPTYEKEGVTALRIDYRWGIGGQLAGILAPGDKFGRSGYAVRLATHIHSIGYDVALTVHQVDDSTSLDYDTKEPIHQRRRALGLDFSGCLFGPGFWLEGNYNQMEIEDDFIRAVVGLDYTLENGTYIMLEALYNERSSESSPYPALDWLEYIYFGEPISRYRFMTGLRKDLTDLVSGSVYWIGGSDGSMVLNPHIDASIAQNANLVLFGAVTLGEEEGQFPPGSYAITARITVYF